MFCVRGSHSGISEQQQHSGELIGNAGSQALPQTAESETQDWSSNLCPKEPSGGF